MAYDIQTYLLASAYGRDRGLTDNEIAKLSQSVQTHLEEEIDNLLFYRKEPHDVAL
jgi:hypothetical protein